MDKQKQIEEMARTFGGCHITPNCKVCCAYSGSTDCPNKTSAEKLYNAGYRKIPENAVVVSRAEYNDLKGLEKHFDDYLIKEIVATRKETVKKFAERLKDLVADRNCNDDYDWEDVQADGQIFIECVDEICKELTEGK